MSQVFINKGLNAIVPVFLIPYYNKIFGVEQYGELVFVQSVTILLMFISDYGFNVTGTREASVNQNDADKLANTLSSIYIVKIALTLLCYGIIMIFGLIVHMTLPEYALYLATFSAFAFQSLTPFWFFQGIRRNIFITVANLLSKALLVILVFVVIVPGSEILTASLIEWFSYVVALAVSNLVIVFYLKQRFVKPSWKDVKRQFQIGKDVFVSTILNWSVTSGAIILLKYFATNEELGYYGTFTRMIYYVYAVLQPVNQAMFPYISSAFGSHPDSARKWILRLGTFYFLAVGLLLIMGLLLSHKFFELFFDFQFLSRLDGYFICYTILFIWVCIVLLNNFVGIQCLMAARRDAVYRRYYTANAIVAMIGFVILIPCYKGLGASIAILTGEVLLLGLLLPNLVRTVRGIEETSQRSI